MSNSQQHFKGLFQKVVSNQCTDQELVDFFQHIKQLPEDDTLVAELDAWWQTVPAGNRVKEKGQRIWELIEAGKSSIPATVQPVTHRVHFLKTAWFRYAAAIIMILGTGTYLWLTPTRSPLREDDRRGGVQTKASISPRGNKAILTLADGSQIILDSAANGSLAQQGNTKIIKLDAGQLAYNTGNVLSKEILYNTISTPKGGQYQITLPDGSKVWLNAASSIRFPTTFTGSKRSVEVTGEVYFEVKVNKSLPFFVTSRGMEVQVLGTSFNVNAYADEETIKTTLVEGSVKVTRFGKGVLLAPGQQAVVTDPSEIPGGFGGSKYDRSPNARDDKKMESRDDKRSEEITVQTTDIDQVLAWKNGFFEFNDTPFEAIMRQLARWYDLEVEYRDLISERFGATIPRNSSISEILDVLELTHKVKFTIEGKKVIVSRP